MLSRLQKFILRELFLAKRLSPGQLRKYYAKQKNAPSRADQKTIVTRSLERLVGRGYCKIMGRKTKEKWFIDSTELTPKGSKKAREIMHARQLTLYSPNK